MKAHSRGRAPLRTAAMAAGELLLPGTKRGAAGRVGDEGSALAASAIRPRCGDEAPTMSSSSWSSSKTPLCAPSEALPPSQLRSPSPLPSPLPPISFLNLRR